MSFSEVTLLFYIDGELRPIIVSLYDCIIVEMSAILFEESKNSCSQMILSLVCNAVLMNVDYH